MIWIRFYLSILLLWIEIEIKIQSNMFKATFFINDNTETFFLFIFFICIYVPSLTVKLYGTRSKWLRREWLGKI